MRAPTSIAAALLLLGCAGPSAPPPRHVTAPVTPHAPDAPPPAAPSHCSEASTSGPDAVAAVDLRGNAVVPSSELCAVISTRAGQALDDEALAADVRALWATGKVDDVVVSVDEPSRGRRLLFTVRERPVVRKLTVRGAKAVDEDRVRAFLKLDGAPFDHVAIREGVRALRDEYVDRGYRSADVQFRVEPAKGHEVDVVVDVTEGAQAKIDAIRLPGVSKAFEADLRALIDTDGGRENAVGAPYRPDTFERALLYMNAYYYDRGMVQASLGPPEVVTSKDGLTVTITVTVTEGPVFRLGKIRCKGELAGPEKECLSRLGQKPGEVFNRSELAKGVRRISDYQAEKGHGTNVTPSTEVDTKKNLLNLDVVVGR